MRIRILFMVAVLALAGGGCEDEAARHALIEQRVEERYVAWITSNPSTPMTPAQLDLLRVEAVQEVDKAISDRKKLQREAAKEKGLEAVGHAVGGNWPMAGWAALSAALLFFGLKKPEKKEGGTT